MTLIIFDSFSAKQSQPHPQRVSERRDILAKPSPHHHTRRPSTTCCWTYGKTSHFRGNCPHGKEEEDVARCRNRDKRLR